MEKVLAVTGKCREILFERKIYIQAKLNISNPIQYGVSYIK